jgi:hypothetical protein
MRLGGISEIQPALQAILDTAVEGQEGHLDSSGCTIPARARWWLA